jgi:transposase
VIFSNPCIYVFWIVSAAELCQYRVSAFKGAYTPQTRVFRNRAGTTLKILCYDGQGYWLCTKRLSQGRFTWWPTVEGASASLSAREVAIVLWNGNPQQARMADDWKKLR